MTRRSLLRALGAALFLPTSALARRPLRWREGPMLGAAARFPTLTRLANGSVLVSRSAELGVQEPALIERISPDGEVALATPLSSIFEPGLDVVALPSGGALALGPAQRGTPRAQVFDPERARWTVAPEPPARLCQPFHEVRLAALPAGRVLALSTGLDESGRMVDEAAIFDLSSGVWEDASAPPAPRSLCALVALPDGRVLRLGGMVSTPEAPPDREIHALDPSSGSWARFGVLPVDSPFWTAFPTRRGCVALSGSRGLNIRETGAMEVFSLSRTRSAVTLDWGGDLVMVGGQRLDEDRLCGDAVRVRPEGGRETALPGLPWANADASLSVLGDRQLLLVGGAGLEGDAARQTWILG